MLYADDSERNDMICLSYAEEPIQYEKKNHGAGHILQICFGKFFFKFHHISVASLDQAMWSNLLGWFEMLHCLASWCH